MQQKLSVYMYKSRCSSTWNSDVFSEKKRSPVGPERYQKLLEWLKIWGGDEIHLEFCMLQGSDDDCYYHYYKWQSNAELYVDTS